MSQPYILALDLGTTGIRALIYDYKGNEVTSSYKKLPQYFPQPGWVEQSPKDILKLSKQVISEAIKNNNNHPIATIGITNQRETTICWDTATNEPVYNAIVWQCRRTTAMYQSLANYKDTIKYKTGLFLDPYFSGTKLKWILDNVPNAAILAKNNQLRFGTVDTWVIKQLTNEHNHLTDSSNASRTLLYNIRDLNWDTELLDLLSIPKSILPKVIASDSHFGTISVEGQSIPVNAVLGDQQAALFGQGGYEKGIAKATYGTGIFVMTSTQADIPETKNLLNTVAWTLDNKTEYALEGSIFTGASGINWLQTNLGFFDSPKDIDSIIAKANNDEKVLFIPAFTGLGAPHWIPDATASISGLKLSSTKADIIKAYMDSLAHQTQDVIEEMNDLLNTPLAELRVDGGITNSAYLMGTQATVSELIVNKPAYTESTAFGAAACAAISRGIWSRDSIKTLRQSNSISPKPSKESQLSRKRWKTAISEASRHPD